MVQRPVFQFITAPALTKTYLCPYPQSTSNPPSQLKWLPKPQLATDEANLSPVS